MLNLDESSEALHRNLKEKEKENRNLERRYRNEKSDWKRNVQLYSWVQGLLRLLLTQKKKNSPNSSVSSRREIEVLGYMYVVFHTT